MCLQAKSGQCFPLTTTQDVYLKKNGTSQLGITLGYDSTMQGGCLYICEVSRLLQLNLWFKAELECCGRERERVLSAVNLNRACCATEGVAGQVNGAELALGHSVEELYTRELCEYKH